MNNLKFIYITYTGQSFYILGNLTGKWYYLIDTLKLNKTNIVITEWYDNTNHLLEIPVRLEHKVDFNLNSNINYYDSINTNSFNNIYEYKFHINLFWKSDKLLILEHIKLNNADKYEFFEDLFQSNTEDNWNIAYESIKTLYNLDIINY